MDLEGTVHTVGQIEERGQNGFKVCEVILDRKTSYQGQEYPNFTKITLTGKRTELAATIAPGDYVKAKGDVKGRFFTTTEGKEGHAQDFEVWGIEVLRKNASAAAEPAASTTAATNGLV